MKKFWFARRLFRQHLPTYLQTMETSVKIIPSVTLPDSTTTFLSVKEMQESEAEAIEAAASAEAAQAVASLQARSVNRGVSDSL